LSAQKQLSCSHLGLPKYRIPPGQEALILVSAAAESYFNKLLETREKTGARPSWPSSSFFS